MINVIIIEDEIPAMEVMSGILAELPEEVHVQAKLRTVGESVKYFRTAAVPADIIFSDVQLSDGLCFEIFKQVDLKTPVIFTTGYDRFMLLAFENNGIDYILKPVEKGDVQKALWKYKSLLNHFEHYIGNESVARLMDVVTKRYKSRLLVKKGLEHIVLRIEDVILFYTENKITFVIDHFSKKYIVDKTLSELETELDDKIFFRANRQYIINLNYVKGFKTFERVKLLIDLNVPQISHSIIVSQETAQSFRNWMRNA
jgi:two-component system, LytTR family, response regulator